jgi:hypothetical protein
VNEGNADEILIMDRKSKKTHVFQTSNALDAQEWIEDMKSVFDGRSSLGRRATAPPTAMRKGSVGTLESGESVKSEPVVNAGERGVEHAGFASIVEKESLVSKFGNLFQRKTAKETEEVDEKGGIEHGKREPIGEKREEDHGENDDVESAVERAAAGSTDEEKEKPVFGRFEVAKQEDDLEC